MTDINAPEIIKLHARIDEREAARMKSLEEGLGEASREDAALAVMAESAGWKIEYHKIERRIADLLEPVEFPLDTPLDVRAAIGEARLFAIKELRRVLSDVEIPRQVALKNANKPEENKEATP